MANGTMGAAWRNDQSDSSARSVESVSTVRRIPPVWDENVVDDLVALPYVRVVVFTNRQGGLVHRVGRIAVSAEVCEQLDLAIATIERTGDALGIGASTILVATFRGATMVTATTTTLNAIALADPGANLGQLLTYMRRAFPEAHD